MPPLHSSRAVTTVDANVIVLNSRTRQQVAARSNVFTSGTPPTRHPPSRGRYVYNRILYTATVYYRHNTFDSPGVGEWQT